MNSCICQISDVSHTISHTISHYTLVVFPTKYTLISPSFFITQLALISSTNHSLLLGILGYFLTALPAKKFYFKVLPSLILFPNHSFNHVIIFVSWNYNFLPLKWIMYKIIPDLHTSLISHNFYQSFLTFPLSQPKCTL